MTVPTNGVAIPTSEPVKPVQVSRDAHSKGFEHLEDDYSSWKFENARGYKIADTLMGEKKKIKVIAVGAGASGGPVSSAAAAFVV